MLKFIVSFFKFFINFFILKTKVKKLSTYSLLFVIFFACSCILFSQTNSSEKKLTPQTKSKDIKSKQLNSQNSPLKNVTKTNLKDNRKNDTQNNNKNNLQNLTNFNSLTNQLQNSNPEISFTGFYIRTIIILIVGVIILYFGVKFLNKKKGIRIENEAIEVILEYPIFLNRQIVVVKIFGQYYILGVTADNISMIDKIEDEKQIGLLLQNQIDNQDSKWGNQFSFKKILEQMLTTPQKKTKKKSNMDEILNLKDKIDKI